MEKQKTKGLQISEAVHAKLKALAKQRGMQINRWAEIILSEYLDKQADKK